MTHHIYASPVINELSIAVPGRDLSAGHGGSMVNIKRMVMVLDANKGIVTKDVQLPAINHNAVFSQDNKEIWTSKMEMDGKILEYDARTYKLKNIAPVGKDPAEVTFFADESKACVANGSSDDVSVINPTTKAIIATIPAGDEPVAALQAPIIVMSQNRKEEKYRKRGENDYLINLKAELEVRSLHQKIDLLLEEQIKVLFDIQASQLELLKNIDAKLKAG